jgi:hypothetical protein
MVRECTASLRAYIRGPGFAGRDRERSREPEGHPPDGKAGRCSGSQLKAPVIGERRTAGKLNVSLGVEISFAPMAQKHGLTDAWHIMVTRRIRDVLPAALVLLPAFVLLCWFGGRAYDKALHPPPRLQRQGVVDPVCGPKPLEQAFTGRPLAVHLWLQANLTDPDSLVYERTRGPYTGEDFSPKGWVVDVQYRCKNGLGGYVRETRRFIVRNEQVIAQSEIQAIN